MRSTGCCVIASTGLVRLRQKVSISRTGKDTQIQLRVPAGAVLPDLEDPFVAEPPVKREGSHLLNVLILLHVSPRLDTRETTVSGLFFLISPFGSDSFRRALCFLRVPLGGDLLFNPIFGDPVHQSLPADIQVARRLGLIPVELS